MENDDSTPQVAVDLVAEAVATILSIYDDPHREGLRETPQRVAKMYRELLIPCVVDLTTFDSNGYDQMVIQAGIPFYSLCEHHMVPFFGTVAIGYLPDKKLIGISKLARIVEACSHKLQMQETMTQAIANILDSWLEPQGVGVIVRARHLCEEMRGIKKIGAETITSALKGGMMNNEATRAEFLKMVMP